MAVCTPEQVSKRLNELIEDYFNHPPTMKIVGKDGAAFKKLYRARAKNELKIFYL